MRESGPARGSSGWNAKMTQNAAEQQPAAGLSDEPDRNSRAPLHALAGVASALPLAWLLRGFTVDDALITARVASNLGSGHGYRFNVGGSVVDAVTPLGFAQLLASSGPGSVLEMFERARWLGLATWLLAAG